MGLPSSVYAWTPTLLHKINAEDTAQAMLRWDNGAIGSFHSSTAETGQDQRFEIIGTKGHLQIKQGGDLVLRRFSTEVDEFIVTSERPFSAPEIEEVLVETGDSQGDHRSVYQNFISAIQNGTPISADGPSSSRGLELANAMIYSNHTGAPVEFPLNRQRYADLLFELQEQEAG
jgi:predicted dehydrogenase